MKYFHPAYGIVEITPQCNSLQKNNRSRTIKNDTQFVECKSKIIQVSKDMLKLI